MKWPAPAGKSAKNREGSHELPRLSDRTKLMKSCLRAREQATYLRYKRNSVQKWRKKTRKKNKKERERERNREKVSDGNQFL